MMIRTTFFVAAVFGVVTAASAQSYDDFIAIGDATTKQNNMNAPFVEPSSITAVTNPSTWPKFQNREPADRSPKDKVSKLITMGTGTPTGSTFRLGPPIALIVNHQPYFVDAGEGWWRAVNR
jgi:ribonuclease Z